MGLYYNLPLYKETYDFTLQVFNITKQFTREYKYTLGQDMKKEAISIIRNIYKANSNYNKKDYLNQILDDLEVLKLEFRLCKDMQLVSIQKYAELCKIMDVIGKQVNGWNKTQK